jgi:arylsulfatase A-like enzyme
MRPIAALALAVVAWAGCQKQSAPPPPPRSGNGLNILLVTIDTLRADHLGAYGYRRSTSPHLDALARDGALFGQAYTYWPKTRGSMAIMLTGRRPSQNGYSKPYPMLVGFNPTLASVLHDAGYETVAAVDNPNVGVRLGYAKGFDSYRETWEEAALATETDRARAITETGKRFLAAPHSRPFFLWLHYVNPHAPYTPPPPFDTAFLDEEARRGRPLSVVPGYHGGIPKQWAVAGQDRLGYYVAQYDGEIAAVDREIGELMEALRRSAGAARTAVVVTSDHGESLGEHDYYFDHGEDLFDPSLKVPLLVLVPGAPAGQRSEVLASTLDVLPTVLDAVKVSYPPELAGRSLLPAVMGRPLSGRERVFAQNERNLSANLDTRYKLVATPQGEGLRTALYDRREDPSETRDMAGSHGELARALRRELDDQLALAEREWTRTRRLLQGAPGEGKVSPEACEKLKALGYVQTCG